MLTDRTSTALKGAAKAVVNGSRAKKLMKIMVNNQDLWFAAYAGIASNKGALTPGVSGDTLDGFSLRRVEKLIDAIRNGDYRPTPVRRIHIPKDRLNPKGKKRPLGIPSGDDKIVQGVMRMILESIYEPQFSPCSHGFRPNRSCHSALDMVHAEWKSTTWVCEVDIKGFFDNINHDKLLEILRRRIDDEGFIRLVERFLRAGYMEDWKLSVTYSGTPQGGIISPILANIYLHELDEFMHKKMEAFNVGERRRENPRYQRLRVEIYKRQMKIKRAQAQLVQDDAGAVERLKEEIAVRKARHASLTVPWSNPEHERSRSQVRAAEISLKRLVARRESLPAKIQLLQAEIALLRLEKQSLPSVDMQDSEYRRLRYIRYADDFLIGVVASKAEAKEIMSEVSAFVEGELKLEISAEKSRLGALEDGCNFLGYELSHQKGGERRVKAVVHVSDEDRKVHATKRVINGQIRLQPSWKKLDRFVRERRYGALDQLRTPSVGKRTYMLQQSEYEIVSQFNAELRGLANYYNRCPKYHLSTVEWLWQRSLAKTLGAKWGVTSPTAFKRLRQMDGKLALKYHDRQGRERLLQVYRLADRAPTPSYMPKEREVYRPSVDDRPNTFVFKAERSELLNRLMASECEYCADTKGPFEVHHVRKMKDLDKGMEPWKRMMIARRRKTLILCEPCHDQLHAGKLPDWRGREPEPSKLMESRMH
nr:reverse transcriptase domain-containing protein [uncultured Roseateles sp.]